MAKFLESKKQMRQNLSETPFSEKVKALEKLRDRSLVLAKNQFRTPNLTNRNRLIVEHRLKETSAT